MAIIIKIIRRKKTVTKYTNFMAVTTSMQMITSKVETISQNTGRRIIIIVGTTTTKAIIEISSTTQTITLGIRITREKATKETKCKTSKEGMTCRRRSLVRDTKRKSKMFSKRRRMRK